MTTEHVRTIRDDAVNRAVKDRGARLTAWIALTILVLSLVGGGAYFLPRLSSSDARADEQAQHIGQLSAQADRNATDGQKLADQVRALGGTPVVEPSKPAAPGSAVDPAALRSAARTALTEYCAPRNQCRGADGAAPNFDGIVNAVVQRIPVPQNGSNGENGQNATPVMVAAAVADYCGQPSEPCRGAPGAAGQEGARGEKGDPGDPGPTCPPGLELRDAVVTAADGSTYSGKACVDPGSSQPPSTPPVSTTEPAPPTE